MKKYIQHLIADAAEKVYAKGSLPSKDFPDIEIEEPKFDNLGDFATNFAMMSARTQKMAPHRIAQALVEFLQDPVIERVEVAGPGFINFFLRPSAWPPVVRQVLEQDQTYGASDLGKGRKIQVEFVSANPTGPLHVGHGRGAAVGDSVARILSFCGYAVQREYYINDSGRQIQTLGRSVYLRCKQLLGHSLEYPPDCYQGDYIRDLAAEVLDAKGSDFIMGDESRAVAHCARYAAEVITDGIRRDLDEFGVHFDMWFSEQSLFDDGEVERVLEELKGKGVVYPHEGAFWYKTSDYGDEKDRVVVRQNGLTTYFASDIAYHQNKY